MSKGVLEVLLIDAKGLADSDLIGKSDPYVVIQYRDQERKSKIAKGLCLLVPMNSPLIVSVYKLAAGSPNPEFVAKKRGQTAYEGKNPSWNETFKFNVHSAVVDNQHMHKLALRIMDYDTFSADDFIGQATINVGDLIALGLEKGVAELHPSKYSVVLADKTYCGEIRVGVTFRSN